MNLFLPKPKWLLGLSFMLVWNSGYSQQLADATVAPETKNSQNRTLLLKDKSLDKAASLSQVRQAVTVTGQVKDEESGDPLPGVSVLVKNTTNGTITDIDGNFSVSVPNSEAILVFSYVGYKAQEVPVGTKSKINVSLKLSANTLEQVVVVGYGEQKRANLTGAVETLDAKEIEDLPVGNLSQALVGRMAGVRVSVPSSKPGQANPIVIRRQTDKSPTPDAVLYVIDGVIFDDNGVQFNMLDATEVESISILKDGAAAVYGARAGGGVVLVKTKRGGKGKPKFNYSTSYGIGTPTEFPEMLTARQHANLVNEMLDQKHRKYYVTPAEFERNKRVDRFRYFTEDELAAMDTLDYNWLDGLYKDALTIRHTLNVSGGSDNIRYFVGGGYYKETGNIKSLEYERYSFRTNLEADITKDVIFTLGLSTNRGIGQEPYYSGDNNLLRETYKRLLTAPRWAPPLIDGRPVSVDGDWNPYGIVQSNSYRSSSNSNTNITGALDYKVPFIQGLKAKAQFSFNQNTGRGTLFAQNYDAFVLKRAGKNSHLYTNELATTNFIRPFGNNARMEESADQSESYQLNASLSYNRTFGAHQVDGLLVYEQQENSDKGFRTVKTGTGIAGYDQLWAFSNNGITSAGSAGESGRLAYIGRVNYNYKGKYLLESAFRYEASQKFHPDYAWGLFPNVSAGWIISEEGFFRDNVQFVDFLKIRASYGRVGTQPGRAFMWRQSYSGNTTGALFGVGNAVITNALDVKNEGIAIPTVTWQKGDIYNIGVDLRVLNNKINVGFDAFYRDNFDILIARNNVPTTMGIDKPPLENAGRAFSKGVEFSLGHNNTIGTDWNYSVSGFISYNYGRPTFLFQNPAVLGRWDDQLLNDPSNQPGMIALGIIRTQEDLDRVLAMYPTINDVPVEMGMIYYKDIAGENYSEGPDGKLDQWDRTIIAERTNAPYAYGFTLGASWKRLRVSGTFSGAFGHKVFIQKDEMVLPSESSNVFSFWNDYWTPDNPNASMPRPFNYGYDNEISTFWMRDGHTLRLNNVNVSYDLPASLSEKLHLPQFRIFYAGTNLLTIINPFDHKDPSISRAYDYPMVKTSNIGLNVTF